jgi:hypothetical protein
MAVQYAGGTNVNTTFTNTTGTRREIVDGLVAALTTAGWSTVSGGGTGDVKMKCVATPQSNQAIVRIYDPGSGNCARFSLYNTIQSLSQSGDCYLNPGAGKVWRVIANQYQFFIFVSGSTAAREFGMFSCLYIPPFLTAAVQTAAFTNCNSRNDSDGGFQFSTGPNGAFCRSTLGPSWSSTNYQMNGSYMVNNTIWSNNNMADGNTYAGGAVQAFVPQGIGNLLGSQFSNQSIYRYHDGSLHISDPLTGWGTTGYLEEPTIKGQLWDVAIIHESFQMDQTFSFDGRNFWNMTQNNGVTKHSAFVLIP